MGQDLVTLALEDCGGALVVIDMEDQQGLPSGAHEQRVAEEQVHLGHKQAAEDMAEIGRPLGKFDHEHRGLAERDVMLVEKSRDQHGVADDHPGDGGLSGIDDAERKDDDPLLLEKLHHLEQSPDLVVQKDREVTDRCAVETFLGGWR